MKKYKVILKRIKTNEFEVEALSKSEAINLVINTLNNSTLLEKLTTNQVETNLNLTCKKIKK